MIASRHRYVLDELGLRLPALGGPWLWTSFELVCRSRIVFRCRWDSVHDVLQDLGGTIVVTQLQFTEGKRNGLR
jgi:hypothetical protein